MVWAQVGSKKSGSPDAPRLELGALRRRRKTCPSPARFTVPAAKFGCSPSNDRRVGEKESHKFRKRWGGAALVWRHGKIPRKHAIPLIWVSTPHVVGLTRTMWVYVFGMLKIDQLRSYISMCITVIPPSLAVEAVCVKLNIDTNTLVLL